VDGFEDLGPCDRAAAHMTIGTRDSRTHPARRRRLPSKSVANISITAKGMNHNKGKVTGIGGIFFKVRDPERMSAWYREHLGICVEDGHADFVWCEKEKPEEVGRTVWSLFPQDTDYLGPAQTSFMINYRVANLDEMLAQLRRNGVTVEKVEEYEYGRFAWITDPEGNRIELWEPKST
jgi:predicted enzyme related to lactoylglutathione lyase